MDDDCDGDVDEGCSCVNQNTQPCYSGPPVTQNVGLCIGGTQTCTNGAWGACAGETTPIPEQCDGLDNDCDGSPDEGDPNGGSACPTGLNGVCAVGTQHCVNGSLACQQNVQASAEQCDGLDNNCDGGTDENNPGGGAAPRIVLGRCLGEPSFQEGQASPASESGSRVRGQLHQA